MRKIFTIAAVLLLNSAAALCQWSPSTRITSGSSDDVHPAFPVGAFNDNVEWLAFARYDGGHSDIYLMRTDTGGGEWMDTLYQITHDTTVNDYPAFATIRSWKSGTRLLLAWEHGGDHQSIYFTYFDGSAWLPPAPLTSDADDGHRPSVAPSDSTFGLAWDSAGHILYAAYDGVSWSRPEQVTHPLQGDDGWPQLRYYGASTSLEPVVTWEHIRFQDGGHEIWASLRTDNGWTAADTVASEGDNRGASLPKAWFFPPVLTWESWQGTQWDILQTQPSSTPGGIVWDQPHVNITENPNADDNQFSFTINPIIISQARAGGTRPEGGCCFFPTVATWRVSSDRGDTIAGAFYNTIRPQALASGPPHSLRNPTISKGFFFSVSRYWSVWEAQDSGRWNLFGASYTDIADVKEEPPGPRRFFLEGNYPNPFNPSTTVAFEIPARGLTKLEIFDVLGRPVATLADDVLGPGGYERTWDASHAASGMYFCRLTSGNFSTTVKMLLVR